MRKTVIELKQGKRVTTDTPASLIANNLTFTGIAEIKDMDNDDIYVLTTDAIILVREYEEKEETEENEEQGKENPERNVTVSVHPRINKNYVRL